MTRNALATLCLLLAATVGLATAAVPVPPELPPAPEPPALPDPPGLPEPPGVPSVPSVVLHVPGLSADFLDGRDSTEFAAALHDHDERYFTRAQSDVRFAAIGHDHDGRYLAADGKASDADALDGLDSAAFAAAGHHHDGRYLTPDQADERFLRADQQGDMGGNRIANVADPAASTDAATKAYVDRAVGALPAAAQWSKTASISGSGVAVVALPASCRSDVDDRGCLFIVTHGADLQGAPSWLARAEYVQFVGEAFASPDRFVASGVSVTSGGNFPNVLSGVNGSPNTNSQLAMAGGSNTNHCVLYADYASAESSRDHVTLVSGNAAQCHLYVRSA